jgi:hypothetical protein
MNAIIIPCLALLFTHPVDQSVTTLHQLVAVLERSTGTRGELVMVADQPKVAAKLTVPRPCYVATMEGGDRGDILVTDQISFVSGFHWHRHYQRVGTNGKVVDTCRAIYDVGRGSGPFNPRAPHIYVKSQSWWKGLGSNTLIRECSRDAANMVGRPFQFRMSQNAIIETVTGRVFSKVGEPSK